MSKSLYERGLELDRAEAKVDAARKRRERRKANGAGEAPATDADGRPVIHWVGGALEQAVSAAEAAILADGGEAIYQRAGSLVRVVRLPSGTVRGFKRPDGTLGILPVEAGYLTERFSVAASWVRWDDRTIDGWKRIAPPPKRRIPTWLGAGSGACQHSRGWSRHPRCARMEAC